MPSSYPGALDSIAANKTNATVAVDDHAPHHNALADAINALQSALGVNMANVEAIGAVAAGVASASGDPLNTTATDKITTHAEAAQFLRQAALGGGTWTEINNLLQSYGSRKDWLTEQIYTPDAFRASPVWNVSDPTLPAPGYFSNVCRALFPPRGNGGASPPSFVFPGITFTDRCLLTAFLNNTNEDPLAAQMHTAVNSVPGNNGGSGLGGPTGNDGLETLRLKCTWILSKFIPCSVPGGAWDSGDKSTSITMWYSLLHRAAFGTYADLLEDVTYSPPMSNMLTYIANRKEADGFQPDENYARELMQLFTIGLYELNSDGTYKRNANGDPIQTYNNEDVYQLARVFTGLVRMDRGDGDQNKHNAVGNPDWAWNTYLTYHYEHDTPAIRENMSYTPLFNGLHAYCSYDGNITYNNVDLRALSATTTVAIAESGEITTVTVASTTGWPPNGDIQIDDEIFHYSSITATTFSIFATSRLNDPAQTTRRGHMLSTIGAHPSGSTVKYWKPYWYEPGVSARLRHYLPFYEFGAKNALGGRINIPANTEPRKNIRMAIDALVAHPNTAPFVAKNLIKHMVTSNPTPGYVARVARVFENDGQGVRGNLGAVWTAILTDVEACNTTKSSQGFGRILDSFELYAATTRPFHRVSRAKPQGSTTQNSVWVNQVYQSNIFTGLINTTHMLGTGSMMWPYMAPSIFGYYPPDYQVSPGSGWGLITPELGAYSSFGLMAVFNAIWTRALQGEPRDSPHATVTISIASPGVVSWTDHQLTNGTAVVFSTTGALPTGLVPFTRYFIVNAATNTFQVSATSGGAAINTSGAQSGVHTAWAVTMADVDPLQSLLRPITSSYEPAVSATASAADLIQRLNLLLCGGNLSSYKRFSMEGAILAAGSTRATQENRISGAIQLLMYTPEFFTQ
jgi:hypothetical protein